MKGAKVSDTLVPLDKLTLEAVNERLAQLQGQLTNLGRVQDSRAASIDTKMAAFQARVDVLDPHEIAKCIESQRGRLNHFGKRMDSMVTRYTVISEFLNYALCKQPSRAADMVCELLQYMDESDETWEQLARLPLGEIHAAVISRSALRLAARGSNGAEA